MKTLKQEINAALSLSRLRQRVEAYLAIDPTGRPGAEKCREYQQRFRARLSRWDRARQGHVPLFSESAPEPHAVLRADRWTLFQRDEKRARATGDDATALRIAGSYHNHVRMLYLSSRGGVYYGRASEGIDRDAYSKSYGYPARWKNAGCWIEYNGNERTIMLETFRNNLIRLPWPHADRIITGELVEQTDNGIFLDGDIYGTRRGNTVYRYRLRADRKRYERSGLAVLVDNTWEHGATLEIIKQEIEHKRMVAAEQATAQKLAERTKRKARLIALLCGKMPVTIADARACGFCRAGIEAFLNRHNLTGHTEVPARLLKATGDRQAKQAVYKAALALAEA